MIAALLLVWNIAQLWRDTNSHAANAHGVKSFAQKKYVDAVKDFGTANTISPSAKRAFNLGTAQVAAGNREQGSTTLAKATKRKLRPPNQRQPSVLTSCTIRGRRQEPPAGWLVRNHS